MAESEPTRETDPELVRVAAPIVLEAAIAQQDGFARRPDLNPFVRSQAAVKAEELRGEYAQLFREQNPTQSDEAPSITPVSASSDSSL